MYYKASKHINRACRSMAPVLEIGFSKNSCAINRLKELNVLSYDLHGIDLQILIIYSK